MNASPRATSLSLGRGKPGWLFISLLVGPAAIALSLVAFVAALPQIAVEFGTEGTFVAQMTISMAALGLMLGGPVTGWLLARAGTRGTLAVASVVFGLAGAAGIVAAGPTLLLASRVLVGLAAGILNTACFWGIGTEYREGRRARAFGIATAFSNVTSIVGVVLGGVLAQRHGWHFPFVQYPVFGGLALLLVLLNVRQVRPKAESGARQASPFFVRLLPFYLLAMLLFLVLFMASTQFVFLLQLDGIASPTARSLFLGTYTLVGALIGACYGPLQERLSPTGAFALGMASMAAALAILGGTASPVLAGVGTVLIGVHIGILGTYVNHFVAEQTDTATRSHALGFLMTFCYLGATLNAPVLTPLAHWIGPRNVFLLAALIMAVLAVGTAGRLRLRRADVVGESEGLRHLRQRP